jgi:hypothetical protein
VTALALAVLAQGDAVFAEDFEKFDKSRWDDFGATPEAIEVVEGGFRGRCVRISATHGERGEAEQREGAATGEPGVLRRDRRLEELRGADPGEVTYFLLILWILMDERMKSTNFLCLAYIFSSPMTFTT